MNKTTKIAIYARVSTTDQRADLQLDELRQLAQARGWTITNEYVDHGISGTNERRPELDRLMADARRMKFKIVVVWRFDRFGRSLRHLVTALDEFRDLGIGFVSLNDAVDTGTPSGRMLFGVIAAMAQFEAELARERTISGLAAAVRRGVRLGRPVIQIDLERARTLRAEGKSFRAAANELGVSVGKLHEALRGRVRESRSDANSVSA